MLERGLVWVVGDGESINVWKEPLLFDRDEKPRVRTQMCEGHEDL